MNKPDIADFEVQREDIVPYRGYYFPSDAAQAFISMLVTEMSGFSEQKLPMCPATDGHAYMRILDGKVTIPEGYIAYLQSCGRKHVATWLFVTENDLSHSNLILIDLDHDEMEIFEPYGDAEGFTTSDNILAFNVIRDHIVAGLGRNFDLILPSDTCPKAGPQAIHQLPDNLGPILGWCQLFTLLYVSLRIINPQHTREEIHRFNLELAAHPTAVARFGTIVQNYLGDSTYGTRFFFPTFPGANDPVLPPGVFREVRADGKMYRYREIRGKHSWTYPDPPAEEVQPPGWRGDRPTVDGVKIHFFRATPFYTVQGVQNAFEKNPYPLPELPEGYRAAIEDSHLVVRGPDGDPIPEAIGIIHRYNEAKKGSPRIPKRPPTTQVAPAASVQAPPQAHKRVRTGAEGGEGGGEDITPVFPEADGELRRKYVVPAVTEESGVEMPMNARPVAVARRRPPPPVPNAMETRKSRPPPAPQRITATHTAPIPEVPTAPPKYMNIRDALAADTGATSCIVM